MNDAPIAKVRQQIQEFEDTYRNSAWRWKFGYRACLVAATLLSTGAAIIGKLEYFKPPAAATDVTAILAGITAVLTTLIAALDFESNWRLNRRSRHEVLALKLESHKTTADADALLANLQEIVHRRSEALNRQDQ